MAVTYGFFNSLNGDRTYNADQMSEYFNGLISNGVYESVGGALQVLAGSGMTVNVQSGRAIVNCKWLNNDAALTLNITQAHAILNRYTAVVARLDIVNRLMTITTKDGTPASSPIKPVMQNDNSMVELCLAYIYVGAGTSSISQADITDMRPSELCGWVTGIVQQVDTSTLFLQWQTAYQNYYDEMTAEFTAWLDSLTQQLNVNTYIVACDKTVSGTGSQIANIPLNMTGYEYDEDDIFIVDINGLITTDFTVNTSGATPTIVLSITNTTSTGNTVHVKVLKSKIGFNTIIGSDNANIIGSDNSEIIGS
jgi:hypothetical protein